MRSFRGTFTRASGSATRTETPISRSSSSASPPHSAAAPPVSEDLADPERAGLLLVEAERGDELAGERLELGVHGAARVRGLARVEAGRLGPSSASDSCCLIGSASDGVRSSTRAIGDVE